MSYLSEDQIIKNTKTVFEKIEKVCKENGIDRSKITVVGVTKTKPAQYVKWGYEAGLVNFGENYVQEFLKKYEELGEFNQKIKWHFIGHLQSNKVKYIIDKVSLIHSVDRESLAAEIEKRAAKIGKKVSILIEVNVGEEESKSGCREEELFPLVEKILKMEHIELQGLMTIPPFLPPHEVVPYFRKLKDLKERVLSNFPELKEQFVHLSMGMSNDFMEAIKEGATIVRIGTSIFGKRE